MVHAFIKWIKSIVRDIKIIYSTLIFDVNHWDVIAL